MINRIFGKLAFKRLESSLTNINSGTLKLETPDGKQYRFEGASTGVQANIKIIDWGVFFNGFLRGDVGFAEDYMHDNWSTNDLVSLVTHVLENKHVFDGAIAGTKVWRKLIGWVYTLKINSIKGSKKNIEAHYDLGNDFYSLWLDQSMSYSSAIFKSESDSLQTAQHNKYSRILDLLDRDSGRLLEIGCGWGGFIDQATVNRTFDIKAITLSNQQEAFAKEKFGDVAEIALEDYRHQTSKYDCIVSIEMFEAVGEKYWSTFFNKIRSLLNDDGQAVIQTIVIDDDYFEEYRVGGDFIRSFIFPGGMLPTKKKFREVAGSAGLKIEEEFLFGSDYAKTLKQWLDNFEACLEELLKMGYDSKFINMWRMYLAACIAAFTTGRTNVMQVKLSR